MATTYEELVQAGAPALPGSLFYRVKFDYEGDLKIQVRQPLPYFGSRSLATRLVRVEKGKPALPKLVAAAQEAAEALRLGMEAHELLGDFRKGGK